MSLATKNVEGLLSNREYEVYVARKQGKAIRDVANELGVTDGAVKSAQNRALQKLKSAYGVEFRNPFVTLLGPQDNSALVPTVDSLQNNLSPLEFKIFCLMKMGINDYPHIARLVKTTNVTVRMLVIRIRKKLGTQYMKFLDDKTQIKGLTTIGLHSPERCSKKKRVCDNCKHFWGTIESGDGKKLTCFSHGIVSASDEKTHSCARHVKYIASVSEKDELLETLSDKGFIHMAYSFGTGYETTNQIERSMYGASGAGYVDYHERRKSSHRATMDSASRYTVVVIKEEDRKRKEVRSILKYLNLYPSKVDYDLNDNGEKYSTAHYIIKDKKSLMALMQVLIGEVDMYFAKNKLIISFQKKVLLKSLLISSKKKHQTIKFDKQSKEHFSVNWNNSAGTYTISLDIGGVALRYQVEVSEHQGQFSVESFWLK